MSELTASGIDEVDELSSLPYLKPGGLRCPFALDDLSRQNSWDAYMRCAYSSQAIARIISTADSLSLLRLHQGGCIPAGVFTTNSQYKKAHKKRDKLARRAGRAASGAKPGQQSRLGPESPATPMVMETSFAFGSFEQHTTGSPMNLLERQQRRTLPALQSDVALKAMGCSCLRSMVRT